MPHLRDSTLNESFLHKTSKSREIFHLSSTRYPVIAKLSNFIPICNESKSHCNKTQLSRQFIRLNIVVSLAYKNISECWIQSGKSFTYIKTKWARKTSLGHITSAMEPVKLAIIYYNTLLPIRQKVPHPSTCTQGLIP